MRADLEALLEDMWDRSANGTRALSFKEIYANYEDPSDNHEFLESLYPHFDLAVASASGEAGESADDDPVGIGGTNTGLGYLWFASPYYVANAARERVVIHANPYKRVVRLMKMIHDEMLRRPPNPRYAGVNSAKVATLPCFSSGRNDTIIVYTSTSVATLAVMYRIRRWIDDGELSVRDFLPPLPYLIKEESRGIGWASEPPDGVTVLESYPQKLSFGKYLSQTLQIGLQILVDNNSRSKGTYARLLENVLTNAGFNVDEPHQIGMPTPLFMQSVPWPSGQERKSKPLYVRMMNDQGLRPYRSTG